MQGQEHIPDAISAFTGWGGALLVLFGIVSGMAAGTVWLGRKIDRRITQVHNQVEKRTDPIQSDANGGNSLPDVARAVEANAVALASFRASNEAFHAYMSDEVKEMGRRLEDHSASPVHDRRTRNRDNGNRRRTTDREE